MRQNTENLVGVFAELMSAGQFRSDLAEVITFPARRHKPGQFAAVHLFWEVRSPRNMLGQELSPLATAHEELLLGELAEIGRECRVSRQPDADPAERLQQVNDFVHARAAWALKAIIRHGYSDDVRTALKECESELLLLNPRRIRIGNANLLSLEAVAALVLDKISRIHDIDGAFVDSLNSLAHAADFLTLFDGDLEVLDEDVDSVLPSMLREWTEDLVMDSEFATRTAEKALGERCQAWEGFALACEALAYSEAAFDTDVDGLISSGDLWSEHWQVTRGRALERLRPNELIGYFERKEDEQAKDRLETYFFSEGVWQHLPEKAQGALIEADRAWFSTKAGNVDIALSQIKIATEVLFSILFWEPLKAHRGEDLFSGYSRIMGEVELDKRNPSVSDFRRLLQEPNLDAHLDVWSLPRSDEWREFFKKLAPTLGSLAKMRNVADHDSRRRGYTRAELRPVMMAFFGIGEEGILSKLGKLYLKKARRS